MDNNQIDAQSAKSVVYFHGMRRRIMAQLWALFFLALILPLVNANAAARYVSTTGSNSNPGTLAAPWRTLSYSVNKLQAGDTLYALGGTYAETVWVGNSGTSASPITITAYAGQKPVIDGATLSVGNWAALLSLAGNYINMSGFEIRNINVNGYGGNGGSAAIQGGDGVNITGANVTINGLTVHNTWAQGVIASGNNATIENNTIYYVAMSNCRLSGQPNCSPTARDWPSCVTIGSPFNSGKITQGGVISGNTVYNCWGEGVSTWLSNGVTIQNNIVYDNWAENIYVDNATNAVIQRNIVYNTPNNYVQAHAGFALADEIANTNPALNQLSSGNSVVNNLIFNAQFSAYGWTNVAGSGLNNVLIANNTIVSNAAFPGSAIFVTGSTTNGVSVINKNSTIVNNIVNGTVTAPSATGLTFTTNSWSTSPPAAARGAGDVIGNPQLAETGSTSAGALAATYFKLLSSSPAIGKGMVLSAVKVDFNDTTRPAPPNIGGVN
jgi:parallel beta-helix repeat protein